MGKITLPIVEKNPLNHNNLSARPLPFDQKNPTFVY